MIKKKIRSKYFKSEKQLMDVINFLPDATFAIDKDGCVILWNHAMEDLTGVRSYDIVGKCNYEHSIPFYKTRRPVLADLILTSSKETEELYPSLARVGDAIYGESFMPAIKNGIFIWGIAKPLYDRSGNIIGAIESLRDITEQKKASETIISQKNELQSINKELIETVYKLQEKNRAYEEANSQLMDAKRELANACDQLSFSEEKFSKAFKSSPVVVSLSTVADGRYVDVSDSFYENSGYTKEEVIGHTAYEIGIWDNISDRERILNEIQEKGRVRDIEIRFRQKDGNLRTKLFSADVITISGIPHLLAFNADITERKIAEDTIRKQKAELESVNEELKTTIRCMEEAHSELIRTQQELIKANEMLRFSEEKFSKTVHLGPVIITLTRMDDGIYIEVSDYFLKLTGYSREEVIGHSALELNIWKDVADRAQILVTLKNEGVVHEHEIRFMSKDRRIHLMRYSAGVISISGVQHIVSVAIDITERKRIEEEKENLEKQLLQAQKMESLGRLAGGIAHDFNNLLTAIIGNVELCIIKTGHDSNTYPNLEMIKKASESAAALTRQLLAFSRRQIIEPRTLNLNEMIDHIKKMLVRLIGENVNLNTLPDAVNPKITADPGNIEQILVNLSINARDAMPEGGDLTLQTVNVVLDEDYCRGDADALPGQYVMMSVNDTGIGISDEVKKHLFEPFFTTKPRGKGTGLGLSMVYGAVKQNRGFIEVYSAAGKGTSFRIFFPCSDEEVESVKEVATTGGLHTGTETILIVEDDPMVLEFTVNVLKTTGYRVLQANSGEDALEAVESYNGEIDLLITDVVLPGKNGKIIAEELRKKRPGLKVLFTSGYTENLTARHGIPHEKINFLSKPYSIHTLSEKIRDVITEE